MPFPTPDASWPPEAQAMYGWAEQTRIDFSATAEIFFAAVCIIVFLAAMTAIVTAYRVQR